MTVHRPGTASSARKDGAGGAGGCTPGGAGTSACGGWAAGPAWPAGLHSALLQVAPALDALSHAALLEGQGNRRAVFLVGSAADAMESRGLSLAGSCQGGLVLMIS